MIIASRHFGATPPSSRLCRHNSIAAQCSVLLGAHSIMLACIHALLRLQPIKDTRERQSGLWGQLILDYCRSNKVCDCYSHTQIL